MKKTNKFSPEVRKRAVRLIQEHRAEYPSLWAVVYSIAPKIGRVSRILLEWVKRDGLTSSEHERLKQLERENKELRRANEILKWVSDFTYVSTWPCWLYVAFVIDVFARLQICNVFYKLTLA